MYYLYADVYFLINLSINYLLLYMVAYVCRHQVPPWRLVAAAFTGALYALGFLFPSLRFIYDGPWLLLFPVTMLGVAFAPVGLRRFARLLGHFYLFAFLMGGAAYTISHLCAGAGVLVLQNRPLGDWWFYLLLASVTAVFARLVWWKGRSFSSEEQFLPVKIAFDGREVQLTGLVDTGNRLTDPVSGLPTVVVEVESARSLFPEDQRRAFCGAVLRQDVCESALSSFEDDLARRLTFVPYSVLGSRGVMLGLRPDHITIEEEVHSSGQVVVAFHAGTLDADDAYQTLIPPELATESDS